MNYFALSIRLAVIGYFFYFPLSISANTLTEVLKENPTIEVIYDEEGKFKQTKSFVYIEASLDQVWEVLTDIENLASFIPVVVSNKVKKRFLNGVETRMRSSNPGPDVRLDLRYEYNKNLYEMYVHSMGGDLGKMVQSYKLTPHGKGVILARCEAVDQGDIQCPVKMGRPGDGELVIAAAGRRAAQFHFKHPGRIRIIVARQTELPRRKSGSNRAAVGQIRTRSVNIQDASAPDKSVSIVGEHAGGNRQHIPVPDLNRT